MKQSPEKIIARLGSCRCGCEGRDPWHASSYRRVVRNRAAVAGPFLPLNNAFQRISERGTVSLPGRGTVAVELSEYSLDGQTRCTGGAWTITKA